MFSGIRVILRFISDFSPGTYNRSLKKLKWNNNMINPLSSHPINFALKSQGKRSTKIICKHLRLDPKTMEVFKKLQKISCGS